MTTTINITVAIAIAVTFPFLLAFSLPLLLLELGAVVVLVLVLRGCAQHLRFLKRDQDELLKREEKWGEALSPQHLRPLRPRT